MPKVRAASDADREAIKALLTSVEMRTDGVQAPGTRYWVAEADGAIVGAIGLELGAAAALLRSAIVAPRWRAQGIGSELTTAVLAWAQANGCRDVYCFSTDAGSYWRRQGFVECPVDKVVAQLPTAPQVLLFGQLGWLPTEVAFKRAVP